MSYNVTISSLYPSSRILSNMKNNRRNTDLVYQHVMIILASVIAISGVRCYTVVIVDSSNNIGILIVINIISALHCVCVKRILFILIDSLRRSHHSLSLPGLKQYLERINVSCSRTQTAAVPPVRLEPVALRSRVKHSTIKSLRSLTKFALLVKLQWGFISLYIGLLNY